MNCRLLSWSGSSVEISCILGMMLFGSCLNTRQILLSIPLPIGSPSHTKKICNDYQHSIAFERVQECFTINRDVPELCRLFPNITQQFTIFQGVNECFRIFSNVLD